MKPRLFGQAHLRPSLRTTAATESPKGAAW